MAKTIKGYKIDTMKGIENLATVLVGKLREATESGKDLIVYISVKSIRKEAQS